MNETQRRNKNPINNRKKTKWENICFLFSRFGYYSVLFLERLRLTDMLLFYCLQNKYFCFFVNRKLHISVCLKKLDFFGRSFLLKIGIVPLNILS